MLAVGGFALLPRKLSWVLRNEPGFSTSREVQLLMAVSPCHSPVHQSA